MITIFWLHPARRASVVRTSSKSTGAATAAANYSLGLALATGALTRLSIFCGYARHLGLWNGLPHIEKLLARAGYSGRTDNWAAAATLVVPNYWRPGAADWRAWRLAKSHSMRSMVSSGWRPV